LHVLANELPRGIFAKSASLTLERYSRGVPVIVVSHFSFPKNFEARSLVKARASENFEIRLRLDPGALRYFRGAKVKKSKPKQWTRPCCDRVEESCVINVH